MDQDSGSKVSMERRSETMSAEDIAANGYNPDMKNPHNADTGPGDADELLQEFATVSAEAASVLEQLMPELATPHSGDSASARPR
jgi:type I restriction enzyme M protein